MHPSKSSLHRLAQQCRQHQRKTARKPQARQENKGSTRFFDENNPIELSYQGSNSMYPSAFSSSTTFTDEMEPEFEVQVPVEDAEIIEEETMAPVRSVPTQPDTREIPEPEFSPDVEEIPPIIEDAEIIEEPLPPKHSPKGSLGALQQRLESKDDAKDRIAKEMQQLDFEEDDFARDLQSILAGEAVYDPASKQTKPQGPTPSATKDAVKPKQEPPQENPHAIFDELAQKFSKAQTYDLGEVNLDQRFDQFDQEAEQAAAPAPPPPPLKMDQMDILEDFERMDIPQEEYAREQLKTKDMDQPLHPKDSDGGRVIQFEELQPGDIILSTTDAWMSNVIRRITDSPVSHAGVYIGKNPETGKHEVMESLDDGVGTLELDDSISGDTVTAAFRHPSMTKSIAKKIQDFLQQKEKEGAKFDYVAMIKHIPFRLHNSVCELLPGPLQRICSSVARKIYLGTEENNEFYCSELVFEAFKSAGLPLATTPSDWSTPKDLVELSFNGSLQYVGHLKI